MGYPKKWFAGVKQVPMLIFFIYLPIYLLGFFSSWFLGLCKCVCFESTAFVKFFVPTLFISASHPFCTFLGFPAKLWQCPCSFLTVSCDYRVSAGLLLQAWQCILIWIQGLAWSSDLLVPWFCLAVLFFVSTQFLPNHLWVGESLSKE